MITATVTKPFGSFGMRHIVVSDECGLICECDVDTDAQAQAQVEYWETYA